MRRNTSAILAHCLVSIEVLLFIYKNAKLLGIFKKNSLQFSFYLYLVCLVYVLNLFPIVILYFIIHYGTNSAYMKSSADKLYTTGVRLIAVYYSFFHLISIFHLDNFYNK